METPQLTVSEVAKIAGCHRNTVLRYDHKGMIRAMRDFNNFRRFTLGDALKLKKILSLRKSDNSLH